MDGEGCKFKPLTSSELYAEMAHYMLTRTARMLCMALVRRRRNGNSNFRRYPDNKKRHSIAIPFFLGYEVFVLIFFYNTCKINWELVVIRPGT